MKKIVVTIKFETEVKENEWHCVIENIQDDKYIQRQARSVANDFILGDGRKENFEYKQEVINGEKIIYKCNWEKATESGWSE